MNFDHVWRSGDSVPTVAIAIGRMRHGNTHIGIVYRLRDESDDMHVIHLAFHKKLEDDFISPSMYCPSMGCQMACIIPEIEEIEKINVAVMCRGIARDRPDLPYGLSYDENGCFEVTDRGYDLSLSEEKKWLNCSTFVLTVFRSAGPTIVDSGDWPARPKEDRDWQITLAKWVWLNSDCKHMARILPGVGKARIRPEETTGACLEDVLPAGFHQCEHNGQAILKLIDHQLEPLPRMRL